MFFCLVSITGALLRPFCVIVRTNLYSLIDKFVLIVVRTNLYSLYLLYEIYRAHY